MDETAGGNSSPPPDEWRITKDLVIIKHHTPRTTLLVPTDENCPLPDKYVDILCATETDLDDLSESKREDFWTKAGEIFSLVLGQDAPHLIY